MTHNNNMPKAKEELDKMMEEATVDCYNDDEAFMGVVYYLADRMSFPFRAKWLDDVVEVMGIDDEESGFEGEVLAEIRTEDDEYTVALDELESLPDDTENGKYFISDSPKKPARFNPRRSAQSASSAFYSLSEQIRQQYQVCPVRSTMKYTSMLQNWISGREISALFLFFLTLLSKPATIEIDKSNSKVQSGNLKTPKNGFS